jgi:phospholipid transport system substrate-binding protein
VIRACWVVVIAAFVALAAAVPVRAEEPTAPVEKLHAGLLGVLKESDSLTYEQRFERLAPVLDETFDLAFMAEKVVGRAWKDLKEEDRARWVATFKKFTTANYAGRFVGFTGQSFETLGVEDAANQTKIVKTRLLNPTDENVDLSYRLRQVDGDWRIIDVHLGNTVSELALRRTEYASVLARDGFPGLLEQVEGKIAELASDNEKAEN